MSARVKRATAGHSQEDPAVVAFLKKLRHPLKKEVEAVRAIILGADPGIREGIKWKSPSFRTTEYFATVNTYDKDRVLLVLHRGAAVRGDKGVRVTDPRGLLEWRGKDRALVWFGKGRKAQRYRAALRAIVREWIPYV
jgi:hypothetical protein